jgi:hypothetical protein
MILATHGIIGSSISQFVPLLDTYSGAAAAYSLRKLRTAYTGDAIRVRRASDNTEQNIGFVNNVLDTASLTSFCSGTNGFVTTWYDQSGNGRDATQSTGANQPQIVSSGSVILDNNKPAVQFDGSNHILSLTSVVNNPNYLAIISVYKHNRLTPGVIYSYRDSVTELIQLTAESATENRLQIRSSATAIQILSVTTSAKQKLGFGEFNNVTPLHSLAIDSTNTTTNSTSFSGTLNTTTNYIGGIYSNAAFVEGSIQELILYPSNQSSNRTGIETNINDFYSIY